MGADTKGLRIRIKSVDSTLHLTKAMGLVASSKIRRANDAMFRVREYDRAVSQAVELLSGCAECAKSPYMRPVGGGATHLVVIAGDRGMAGGYNANVFRLLRDYPDAEITAIGRRACDRFGKSSVSSEQYTFGDAMALAKKLCAGFVDGKFDRLGIVGTKYVSMMTQDAVIEWLLPIEKRDAETARSVLFEPDELTVLNSAVIEHVAGKIIAGVRESFASEVAARRMAMDSAGKNAKVMIDELQLEYNRARQSAITQEITEIVAGSGLEQE